MANSFFKDRLKINFSFSDQNNNNQQLQIPKQEKCPPSRQEISHSYFFCFLIFLGTMAFCFVFPLLQAKNNNGTKQIGIWGFGVDPDCRKQIQFIIQLANICGVSPGYEQYPFIYLNNPDARYLNERVCVQDCPSSITQSVNCKTNSQIQNCTSRIALFNMSNSFIIYQSFPYIRSVCVPYNINYFNIIKQAIKPFPLNETLNDIYRCKYIYIFIIFIAIALNLILQWLITTKPQLVSFIFISGFIIAIAAGSVFYFSQFEQQLKTQQQSNSQNLFKYVKVSPSYIESQSVQTYPLISLGCFIGLFIFFIISFILLYRNIDDFLQMLQSLDIQVKFIQENSQIFIVQFVMALILIGTFGFASYIIFALLASGTIDSQQLPFQTFSPSQKFYPFIGIVLAGYFWFYFFLKHCLIVIISITIQIDYFQQLTPIEQRKYKVPVYEATYRLVRYYMGSVAMGSLGNIFVEPKSYTFMTFLNTSLWNGFMHHVERPQKYNQEKTFRSILQFVFQLSLICFTVYFTKSLIAFSPASQLIYSHYSPTIIGGIIGQMKRFSSVFTQNYNSNIEALILTVLLNQDDHEIYHFKRILKQNLPLSRYLNALEQNCQDQIYTSETNKQNQKSEIKIKEHIQQQEHPQKSERAQKSQIVQQSNIQQSQLQIQMSKEPSQSKVKSSKDINQ